MRADTAGQAVQPVPCGRVRAQPVSVRQAIAAVQEDTVTRDGMAGCKVTSQKKSCPLLVQPAKGVDGKMEMFGC